MEEEWRELPGYDSMYLVSNFGEVYSKYTKKVLGYTTNKGGYHRTKITKDKTSKRIVTHKLVMLAFVGEPPEGMVINHIDSDPSNNRLDNLEYITPSQNVKHSYDFGKACRKGENHPSSKLTVEDVINIRTRFWNFKESRDSIHKLYPQITRTSLNRVIAGSVWTHVKGA